MRRILIAIAAVFIICVIYFSVLKNKSRNIQKTTTQTINPQAQQPEIEPEETAAALIDANNITTELSLTDKTLTNAQLKKSSIDKRVINRLINNEKIILYDNDDATLTSQEYEDALEKELMSLKKSLNALRANNYDEDQLRTEVTQLVEEFSVTNKALSDKRLDQSHKLRLNDIIIENPEISEWIKN